MITPLFTVAVQKAKSAPADQEMRPKTLFGGAWKCHSASVKDLEAPLNTTTMFGSHSPGIFHAPKHIFTAPNLCEKS
ncbi:MAG: hypothetical protein KA451_06000 [Methyloversatilis sp.]|jgi:hypothetical protein|nr:hypothetical protein [Methyloversatilis sp.]MBP6193937.1 hypothetical protein [Methyloversatilis sp.]